MSAIQTPTRRIVTGGLSHAWTDGRRDFSSKAETRADHYAVQVDDGDASEAQRLLATMAT